ncbi:quaternary amine ABC transporter ATP-binding protein [Dethiobacter alkaliphilus]|uniref:quaternary amine ABC transporter ATP-binding protein n=1 Tax=Dethiobacter alkaliphilus TaxID=427926 RepID=UPI002226E942|nr:glycine betaine/L-proline ABC transporter ATP-binding protein [Dethiobacter alkaliphilus]MCW3489067.1 glycine betaine/L-proline ABC transporter ATP-binding protein [Dethiobacter alkaliphilus]
MSVKVKVENVTKIFGGLTPKVSKLIEQGASKEEILKKTGRTVGINDVSFDVCEGEIFVIMGLSGSGKSTMIRCLNLLNKITKGKIYVDGENIAAYDKKQLQEFRKKKIAMVFQHFGLLSHRNVLKNVEYGLEVKGVGKAEREETARKALDSVGLAGWEEKMPNELSGGMQQRVGLARALANDPDILLMDEPFSALDPLIRREMQFELMDLQKKLQKTIIFITHDINEAFKIGDRVAVMKDGKIEQIGTPDEILDSPNNEYIERFIEDIDRTKILQAKNIMFQPSALISVREGLNAAVKEMQKNGISSIYVVDADRKLKGIVTIDDTLKAIKEKKTLQDILSSDYYTADPEAFVKDLIPEATDARYPIAVVDGDNTFLGIISRVSVLASLI